MGGRDFLPNLVLLCLTCHRDIHKHEHAAAGEGWIAWADPDVTPVLLGERYALLTPDGQYEWLTTCEGMSLLEYVNGVKFSGKDFWRIS